ncbi:MAG: TldD/PmbA family protein [Deltaproteobacteria bacterium]|nr:TldD/PmbA family protein [Deltaproteobacteria bacterium]
MHTRNSLILTALLVLLAAPVRAGEQKSDAMLEALETEVSRAMSALGKTDSPPYFLAVEVTEAQAIHIIGEEGGLQGYSPVKYRWVDVDIRLGSPELDSTHALRAGFEGGMRGGRNIPLGDDPLVLRQQIWREIESRYMKAKDRWAQVESERQVLVAENAAEDLAKVEPAKDIGPAAELGVDRARWEDEIRKASAELAKSEIVFDGSVQLMADTVNRWFVSSEGTRLRHAETRFRLGAFVDTMAADGEKLTLHRFYEGASQDELPDTETLCRSVRELEQQLQALRAAPPQEPYSGPAILSGKAAAVFFHEILGHRLEGHRLKQITDAQTFRDMLGKPILPEFLTVTDEPDRARYGDSFLFGHYRYDNQGVPGEKVVLVKDGVLERFLESRSTERKGGRSNGHGRRQYGRDAVTRQGNLIISASRSVPDAELRKTFRAQLAKQGLDYGLYIDEIHGGFTFTGRTLPNAFDVKAVVSYRVFADGRPDELVRGVDLIGTPLVTFSRIVATSDQPQIFNGFCGAESGSVPVSAVSPALLVSQIETQRKFKGQQMPPLLPPPGSASEEVAP